MFLNPRRRTPGRLTTGGLFREGDILERAPDTYLKVTNADWVGDRWVYGGVRLVVHDGRLCRAGYDRGVEEQSLRSLQQLPTKAEQKR